MDNIAPQLIKNYETIYQSHFFFFHIAEAAIYLPLRILEVYLGIFVS